MPRYLRTFDEIKQGVALHFQGFNYVEIAIAITETHLTKLYTDGYITKDLLEKWIEISKNRQTSPRDENIKDLLAKMKAHLIKGTKLKDSIIRAAIVHPKRIRSLAKTEQWIEFQESFEKEHTLLEAKKVAKKTFQQNNT